MMREAVLLRMKSPPRLARKRGPFGTGGTTAQAVRPLQQYDRSDGPLASPKSGICVPESVPALRYTNPANHLTGVRPFEFSIP